MKNSKHNSYKVPQSTRYGKFLFKKGSQLAILTNRQFRLLVLSGTWYRLTNCLENLIRTRSYFITEYYV